MVSGGSVEFRVGGEVGQEKVYTFLKPLIAQKSKVFQVMFSSRWSNADSTHISHLPYFQPHIFEHLLRYLLTDELDSEISVEDLLEVIQLADYYAILQLRSNCIQLLSKKITVDTCLHVLKEVQLFEDIRIHILHFLGRNLNELIEKEEFLSLEEEELSFLVQSDYTRIQELNLFKALCRWGDAAKSEENGIFPRFNSVQRLSFFLRFGLMSPEQIMEEVVPSRLLTLSEAHRIIQFQNGIGEKTARLKAISKLRCGNKGELKVFPVDVHCRLECFKNFYYDRVDWGQPVTQPLTYVPQLLFKTNSAVYIRGLKFYGFHRFVARGSNSKFDVGYTISSVIKLPKRNRKDSRDFCGAEKKVCVSEFGDSSSSWHGPFDVLLKKPFRTMPGMTYCIRAALNLDKLKGVGFVSYGIRRRRDERFLEKTSGLETFHLAHDESCKEQFLKCAHPRSWRKEEDFHEDNDRGITYKYNNNGGKEIDNDNFGILGQTERVGIVHSILFTSA